LRWAVEGCLAWQHHGLGLPDAVRVATDAIGPIWTHSAISSSTSVWRRPAPR
jgi:hypothetical protein